MVCEKIWEGPCLMLGAGDREAGSSLPGGWTVVSFLEDTCSVIALLPLHIAAGWEAVDVTSQGQRPVLTLPRSRVDLQGLCMELQAGGRAAAHLETGRGCCSLVVREWSSWSFCRCYCLCSGSGLL